MHAARGNPHLISGRRAGCKRPALVKPAKLPAAKSEPVGSARDAHVVYFGAGVPCFARKAFTLAFAAASALACIAYSQDSRKSLCLSK